MMKLSAKQHRGRPAPKPITIRVEPPRAQPLRKSGCSCGGGCPSCKSLSVAPAHDPAEREADRVADQVMRMPEPMVGPGLTAISAHSGAAPVQRVCAECLADLNRKPAHEIIQRQEDEEEELQLKRSDGAVQRQEQDEEEELIQTKEAPGAGPTLTASTESAISGLRGGGAPLPASERAFFEPRFGSSFADVRIHDGPKADTAAKSINARAFTLGNDIAFAGGEYSPGSSEGRRLMAHELTHTVQQNQGGEGARSSPGPQLMTSDANAVQRRVVDARVSCRNTGLSGGVPGGALTGAQAIAILQAADSEAINLGRRAENLLFFQRVTFNTAAHVADPVFNAALANRFGLSLANPADHATIAILEREFKDVTDFLASGLVRYTCRSGDCEAGEDAFTRPPSNRISLCSPFWNKPNVAHQGATLLHETFHLWWSQINDSGPPLHNAHCFDQFAQDLAGIAIEPGFVGSCVV